MNINPENITAIIVTFNRLELFKQVLERVQNQTIKVGRIIVVNNGSSDGTIEWLAKQNGIMVINQENVGSSGGQYTGIKTAFDLGAEWIWTMDDDVAPRLNCLEEFIANIENEKSIVGAKKIVVQDNSIPQCDTMKLNLTNPIFSIWKELIPNEKLAEMNGTVPVESLTFECVMFNRLLVEKVGLPAFNFFIYGDDTEYFIRAFKNGFNQKLVLSAVLDRLLPFADFRLQFDWKHFYIIRNTIAIDVLHASLLVRLIRPFRTLLVWLRLSSSFENVKIVFKAFKAGYFYKL